LLDQVEAEKDREMTTRSTPTMPSILVAEDERVMSDVIRFNLQRAGMQVTVARHGLDAWERLQSLSFDLLLTDYQMPGLTGVELCRKLRSELSDWPVPVILLSARGLELDAAALREELNIQAVLFKPFSPRELVQVVSKTFADARQPAALAAPAAT
jgi:CheY-like chemotaxis protein